MNLCGGAGLIAPCRVQLLSPNQPCAAISVDRRAKRLQPAISFRLSDAIKHPPTTPFRGARTVSGGGGDGGGDGEGGGGGVAWQAPGAMSSVVQSPPTKTPTVILSHARPAGRPPGRRGIRCANVCSKWGSRPPEYMSFRNDRRRL